MGRTSTLDMPNHQPQASHSISGAIAISSAAAARQRFFPPIFYDQAALAESMQTMRAAPASPAASRHRALVSVDTPLASENGRGVGPQSPTLTAGVKNAKVSPCLWPGRQL
jgi:hypothetical protein